MGRLTRLPLRHLGGHGGVELAEALAQAGLRRHRLGHAPADAARLAAREGLGGEVVDAGVEAVVDEAGEDLRDGGEGVSEVVVVVLLLLVGGVWWLRG